MARLTHVDRLISFIYYMALSHKDWELPNSRIWLAENDIDGGLDRHPDRWCFALKKFQTKIDSFHLTIFISVRAKKLLRKKKVKRTCKTLEELDLPHRRSQSNSQLVQTSYINQTKLFLFLPYSKHFIDRANSVCMEESWPRSCTDLILATSVKILPYWPTARLIRTNYSGQT